MEQIFLSVVIPAYNEEANIGSTLDDILAYLKNKDLTYEIIIVDDGSDDSTVNIAKDKAHLFNNFRILENEINSGKGAAVKKGMLDARGQYVLFMDADNSTRVKELDNILSGDNDGYDVFIASRRLKGSCAKSPLMRKIPGELYILLAKILLGIKVSDINCGFKIFKGDIVNELFSRQIMNDWSYDAEIIYLCRRFGYKVKEFPVNWVYMPTSKVKPVRDSIKSFLSLINIRLNVIKKKYG